MNTSKTRATVGRIVLLFCPALWNGPRPAAVVNTFPGSDHINVNVTVDGANDRRALELFRERGQGNTFTSVQLFDALTDEQRTELDKSFSPADPASGYFPAWAEWPDMPKQTDRITPLYEQVNVLTGKVNVIAEHLSAPAGEDTADIVALSKRVSRCECALEALLDKLTSETEVACANAKARLYGPVPSPASDNA